MTEPERKYDYLPLVQEKEWGLISIVPTSAPRWELIPPPKKNLLLEKSDPQVNVRSRNNRGPITVNLSK